MRFLKKMEQRFGRYAIPHLTLYIIATYAAGYILSIMASTMSGYGAILSYLQLSPALILKGQIWRLVSWLLIPPSGLSFFTLIMLFCYYQLGTLLERVWGNFLYNIYIFSGLILTVIGAFVLYFVTGIDVGQWMLTSTKYVSLSIFLGFALTFPNQQMLFMFVIPIQIKYLAILDIVYLAYEIISVQGILRLIVGVMVLMSLANVLIFFLLIRKPAKATKTQKAYRKQMSGYNRRRSAGAAAGYEKIDRTTFAAGNSAGRHAVHRCAVCGRTELDAPDLEFRFCSRCNGNYEYCSDHLYTHTHK